MGGWSWAQAGDALWAPLRAEGTGWPPCVASVWPGVAAVPVALVRSCPEGLEARPGRQAGMLGGLQLGRARRTGP